jgi:anti-sigma B factor antagonist
LKLKEHKRDGVVILEMNGKLMGGPDAISFNDTLKALIHEGSLNIIVDLAKVNWVNSTGLGILISGYSTMKKSGGDLKLLHVSDRIESIFMVSKLHTVFQSFDDEEEAIASFA